MEEPEPRCLFCDRHNPENHQVIGENDVAYARWDNFPVSPGHLEVIPKRHVVSFFELSPEEVLGIHILLKEVQTLVAEKYEPDGYTIGVNEGESAGRTIHHVHIHLIPRHIGDVPDPRGGIRHVIPGKGHY